VNKCPQKEKWLGTLYADFPTAWCIKY